MQLAMGMIAVRKHSVADYVLGGAFLISPYLFGLSGVYFAHDVFTVLGLTLLGYSILTDYRYSIGKAIPLSMHLTFDAVCGVFVLAAPWIYSYDTEITGGQMALHWILGLSLLSLVAFTDRAAVAVAIERRDVDTTRVPIRKTAPPPRRAA